MGVIHLTASSSWSVINYTANINGEKVLGGGVETIRPLQRRAIENLLASPDKGWIESCVFGMAKEMKLGLSAFSGGGGASRGPRGIT